MAYTKPMTVEQRAQAIAAYRSFRRNLRVLRREFPPQNPDQRDALRVYQTAIKTLGLETAKPLLWIDPNRLNWLEEAARKAVIEYMRQRLN